jgi:hypothetical protein
VLRNIGQGHRRMAIRLRGLSPHSLDLIGWRQARQRPSTRRSIPLDLSKKQAACSPSFPSRR